MANTTYQINSPILVETTLDKRNVEIVIDEVRFIDDKPFLLGTLSNANMDDGKPIMLALDSAADNVPDLNARGLMFKAREQLMQNGFIEEALEANKSRLFFGKGDAFDDIDAAAKEASAKRFGGLEASVAKPVEVMPEPTNTVRGANDPVHLKIPALLEGIDVGGVKMDLSLHDIQFADGQAFLSGMVSDPSRPMEVAKEFVLKVDPAAVKELEGLSDAEVQARLTDAEFSKMLQQTDHEMIFSAGDEFLDRNRLMKDINTLEAMADDGSKGHITLLAHMGQEDPNFVGNLNRYLNSGSGPDNSIKLAMLDSFGVTDVAQRENYIYSTGSLEEFSQKISPVASQDLAHMSKLDILSDIGAVAKEARTVSMVADAAENATMLARAAKAAKWGAKVGGVGLAIGAASTAMASAANFAQVDLADQLNHQDPPILSEDAVAAYKDMMGDLLQNTLVDNAISTADQFVVPSAIVTIGFEARAQSRYQDWLDQYAPNLPKEYVEGLSPTSFDTKTAQMDMLDKAVEVLPESKSGLPESMHSLIDASNAYKASQNALVEFALGKPYMSPEENQQFNQLAEFRDGQSEQLMKAMQDCMEDGDNIRAFLNLLPEDDRLDYVRRLAESDPNREALEQSNPEVASYLKAYGDANILQTRIFGFAEDTAMRSNMDAATTYIMQRAGLSQDKSAQTQGVDLASAGDFTMPGSAFAGDESLGAEAADAGLVVDQKLISMQEQPAINQPGVAIAAPKV